MITVLDACAAAEIVLQREHAERFSRHVAAAEWVMTPTLMLAEITNVLWKYQQSGVLTTAECERALDYAVALPDEYCDLQPLYREAFALARQLQQPAYDAFYLVLARRNNAELLTLDRRLTTAAGKIGIKVADPQGRPAGRPCG